MRKSALSVEGMEPAFIYNASYRLLICTTCGSAIKPDAKSQARHLRKQPHWKTGASLRLHIESFGAYNIAATKDLRQPTAPATAIEGLLKRAAYCCCHCATRQPSRNLEKIKAHISSSHGVKPRLQEEGRDWRKACVQTFFVETKDLHYFEVNDTAGPAGLSADAALVSSTQTAGLETFLAAMEVSLMIVSGGFAPQNQLFLPNWQVRPLVHGPFPSHFLQRNSRRRGVPRRGPNVQQEYII